jgi:hypothetical protein
MAMVSLRMIARKICAVASVAFALASLAAPALACLGLSFEQSVLLGAVPPAAKDSEVIARVEIVDVRVLQRPGQRAFPVARARVLQSIRGVTDRQIVEIEASESSCGGGLSREDVWRQGFIAGRFVQFFQNEPRLFTGRWNEQQAGGHFLGLRAPDTRPWWRMPWSWFYSPWYLRGALMILFLYLLWYVAGWMDRRKSESERDKLA